MIVSDESVASREALSTDARAHAGAPATAWDRGSDMGLRSPSEVARESFRLLLARIRDLRAIRCRCGVGRGSVDEAGRDPYSGWALPCRRVSASWIPYVLEPGARMGRGVHAGPALTSRINRKPEAPLSVPPSRWLGVHGPCVAVWEGTFPTSSATAAPRVPCSWNARPRSAVSRACRATGPCRWNARPRSAATRACRATGP